MENSPVTDRILNRFAGGMRFGETFEAAAQRGSMVESHLDESGSTMLLILPGADHGLSNVRLLGTATASRQPAYSRVSGVIVYARADSAGIALSGATSAAKRLFGHDGRRGCVGYNQAHTSRVAVWEDERDGGGMALVEPEREQGSNQEALTRLIVYPPGKTAADVLPAFRSGDCP